jgi:hypothetical protein
VKVRISVTIEGTIDDATPTELVASAKELAGELHADEDATLVDLTIHDLSTGAIIYHEGQAGAEPENGTPTEQ